MHVWAPGTAGHPHCRFPGGGDSFTTVKTTTQADPLSTFLALTPPKTSSYMCYYVRFSSSATKGARINRREPRNWGALEHRPLVVGA